MSEREMFVTAASLNAVVRRAHAERSRVLTAMLKRLFTGRGQVDVGQTSLTGAKA